MHTGMQVLVKIAFLWYFIVAVGNFLDAEETQTVTIQQTPNPSLQELLPK